MNESKQAKWLESPHGSTYRRLTAIRDGAQLEMPATRAITEALDSLLYRAPAPQADVKAALEVRSDQEKIADYWADWLIDAVGGATQNRALLRDDPAEDKVLTEAIVLNGKKAILIALKAIALSAPPSAALEALEGVSASSWDDLFSVIRRGSSLGFANLWVDRFTKLRAALTLPQPDGK